MKKRRFFVLAKSYLFYYNKAEDKRPNGVIPVGIARVISKDRKILVVIPGRVFELVAETRGQEWLTALEDISKLPLEFPKIQLKEPVTLSARRLTEESHNGSRKSFRLIRMKTQLDNRENIVKQGYLYKAGKVRKAWKKRYIILKHLALYYFETEPEGERPIASGVIPLKGSQWRKGKNDDYAHNVFEIVTPGRVYSLYAITPSEMDEWREAIVNCSQLEMPVPKPPPQAPQAPKEELDLSAVQAVLTVADLTQDDVQEPEGFHISNIQEPDLTFDGGISGEQISNSESRYFLKFGLKPPDAESGSSLVQGSKPSQLTSLPSLDADSQRKTNSYKDYSAEPVARTNSSLSMSSYPDHLSRGSSNRRPEAQPLVSGNQQARRPPQKPQEEEGCCILL